MRPLPHHSREVLWQHTGGPGLEFARVNESASVVQIDGTVLSVRDGAPLRLRYAINCAPDWTVQAVVVSVVCAVFDDIVAPAAPWIRNAAAGFSCSLKHDGPGRWSNTVGGAELQALAGCTTIDLAASAFTHTLAIRAAGLREGDTRDVMAVWIDGPRDGLPRRAHQRYTCLARAADGGRRVRYETLSGPAACELTVDADGMVLDYPDVARRIAG